MPNQKPVFPSHTMSPRILLGPGPSMAHPRVLALPDAIAAASPARQEGNPVGSWSNRSS
jgi:hypothetical protein